MNCSQLRLLLPAFGDRELGLERQVEIEDHLQSCPDCSRARRDSAALSGALRKPDLYYPAPPGLDRQVLRAVRTAERPRWTRRLMMPRLGLASAATVAVVLALAVGVGRRLATGDAAQDVVAAHIRSLMPGHLTDEPSSDHHTIKPWFAGRLDYSPPVPDLSSAGFDLVGGRLDYLEGPVAAVVYRRRQHVISLFVWPSSTGDSVRDRTGTIQGYNVRQWSRGGAVFWAASDLNADELAVFCRLVAATAGRM
jgi:anti-sigma factor RsiW